MTPPTTGCPASTTTTASMCGMFGSPVTPGGWGSCTQLCITPPVCGVLRLASLSLASSFDMENQLAYSLCWTSGHKSSSDGHDVEKVRPSSCVLQVYPEGGGGAAQGSGNVHLPPGSFLSCSSDNTIRLWSINGHNTVRNILSHVRQHTPEHYLYTFT